MPRTPRFELLNGQSDATKLTIRDLCGTPGAENAMSVTNGVEMVVEALVKHGVLKPGMRLFYFDSDNALDEIVIDDHCEFVRFAPGPKP